MIQRCFAHVVCCQAKFAPLRLHPTYWERRSGDGGELKSSLQSEHHGCNDHDKTSLESATTKGLRDVQRRAQRGWQRAEKSHESLPTSSYVALAIQCSKAKLNMRFDVRNEILFGPEVAVEMMSSCCTFFMQSKCWRPFDCRFGFILQRAHKKEFGRSSSLNNPQIHQITVNAKLSPPDRIRVNALKNLLCLLVFQRLTNTEADRYWRDSRPLFYSLVNGAEKQGFQSREWCVSA